MSDLEHFGRQARAGAPSQAPPETPPPQGAPETGTSGGPVGAAPPDEGTTWQRAAVLAPGPQAEGASIRRAGRSGAPRSRWAIAGVAVAVLAAAIAAFLVLRSSPPGAMAFELPVTVGETAHFRQSAGSTLDADAEAGDLEIESTVSALTTLRVREGPGGGIRLRGAFEGVEMVASGLHHPVSKPIRFSIDLSAEGVVTCLSVPLVEGPDGRPIDPGIFSFGPALPAGPVSPGDTWSSDLTVKCKEDPRARISSTGRFVRYEEQGDRRLAVIEGETRYRLQKRSGSYSPVDWRSTAWYDAETGTFVRSSGTYSVGFTRRFPALGRTVVSSTTAYRLEPA